MPSWIDCHVHLVMSGTPDADIRKSQLEMDYQKARMVISTHLQDFIQCGIVAVRDGGDGHGHTLRYKHENRESFDPAVQLKIAGKAWRQAGRYGKLIGDCPKPGESLSEALANSITRPDPVCPDHIKIVNSGLNSLTCFGKETKPQFSIQEMTAVVDLARRMSLPVMVHANGRLPVQIAVESGCSSIEHGFFMGRDNLEKLAERQIVWIPTAITMKAYSDWLLPAGNEAKIAIRNLDHQIGQMRLARKLGVPIALGTDSGSLGVFHGNSAKEELKLFQEAGFSVSEAIQCATLNGARLLGIPNLGSLQPGKRASFTVIDGPPEQLFANLNSLKGLS
ncbi:MAG: amidohydrolase family protein [Desulfatirhabdiaceae bacterium]